MSKGFDMLRDYIEHDALCMRRRKCCDFEYELQQEFAALKAENAKLREFASEAFSMAFNFYHGAGTAEDLRELTVEYRELGIEVIP